MTYVSNSRHIALLDQANRTISEALKESKWEHRLILYKLI